MICWFSLSTFISTQNFCSFSFEKQSKTVVFSILTLMSPIFDMRPLMAYQALRREKSPDLDATKAHSLNFAPSA